VEPSVEVVEALIGHIAAGSDRAVGVVDRLDRRAGPERGGDVGQGGRGDGEQAVDLSAEQRRRRLGSAFVGDREKVDSGRITVNAAVVANPSSLTVYSTSPPTASGDTTRADFINSQLTSGSFSYSPATGLGSSSTPFSGTITSYMQQFLSLQGNNATNAQQLAQGQDVVVNTLQQSYNSATGVNMDAQMSNLIALQNAYSANAHVMAVVQSMFSALLQAQR